MFCQPVAGRRSKIVKPLITRLPLFVPWEDGIGNYRIERDDAEQLLICRVDGFIDDDTAVVPARDWRSAVIDANARFGRLKIMFDNAGGNVMSPKTASLLAEATRGLARPSDRTAVLAANSLIKLQAKRTMSNNGDVFLSEKAARLWLSI